MVCSEQRNYLRILLARAGTARAEITGRNALLSCARLTCVLEVKLCDHCHVRDGDGSSDTSGASRRATNRARAGRIASLTAPALWCFCKRHQ